MIQLGENEALDTQHPDDAKGLALLNQLRASGLSDECIISVVRAAVKNGTMQAQGAERMLAIAGLDKGPPLYKRTWFKITAGVFGGFVVGLGIGWALKD